MSEEIYRGESLTIILRCRDKKGEAVDMTGKTTQVVLCDRRKHVVFIFSTATPVSDGVGEIEIRGNHLLCRLTSSDVARLHGVYLLEIRVDNGSGIIQIAQVPGVRILDTVTGRY